MWNAGVGTKTGCLEKIIRQGETGYIVEDNSPHQLAEKINLLLSNSKDIELVRASVSELSWSNIAEAIIEEYKEVNIGN